MSKVLVLGAGASKAYGYPLGAELRRRILDLRSQPALHAGIVSKWDANNKNNTLVQFQQAFGMSQMYSIDAFLARRAEYAEIGKKCIAAILFSCENMPALFSEEPDKDHWYQYLFNHFAQVDWDDLDFSAISIITFNYDRSLEHFLLGALQAAYGVGVSDATEKLKTLRILHVYGALGETMPGEDESYREYGGTLIDGDWVQHAASTISVIPEGRVDSPTLITARRWLESAGSICFLGFGFDALNVDRLAENEACVMWKLLPTGHTPRNIVGTCFGMTKSEIGAAFGKLTKKSLNEAGEWRFLSTTCTQLLRETLFLK